MVPQRSTRILQGFCKGFTRVPRFHEGYGVGGLEARFHKSPNNAAKPARWIGSLCAMIGGLWFALRAPIAPSKRHAKQNRGCAMIGGLDRSFASRAAVGPEHKKSTTCCWDITSAS